MEGEIIDRLQGKLGRSVWHRSSLESHVVGGRDGWGIRRSRREDAILWSLRENRVNVRVDPAKKGEAEEARKYVELRDTDPRIWR